MRGATVTLTVTPDKGYELDEIHVMNGTTRLTTVSEDEGNHTFVMPANNVVISALFKKTSGTGVHDATLVPPIRKAMATTTLGAKPNPKITMVGLPTSTPTAGTAK